MISQASLLAAGVVVFTIAAAGKCTPLRRSERCQSRRATPCLPTASKGLRWRWRGFCWARLYRMERQGRVAARKARVEVRVTWQRVGTQSENGTRGSAPGCCERRAPASRGGCAHRAPAACTPRRRRARVRACLARASRASGSPQPSAGAPHDRTKENSQSAPLRDVAGGAVTGALALGFFAPDRSVRLRSAGQQRPDSVHDGDVSRHVADAQILLRAESHGVLPNVSRSGRFRCSRLFCAHHPDQLPVREGPA